MTFKNGQEMLDMLFESDLYSKEKGIYVFDYNSIHSIAYYEINNEEFTKLKEKADEIGEYISGLLGPGGHICDDPSHERFEKGDYSNLDWCNDNYEGEWEEV